MMSVIDSIFGFGKDLGIDLGTVNTLVYMKGKGIIVREPSVVAIDKADGRVLAVGNQANEMLGRTPENITAIRPMKDGVIADYDIAQEMIRTLLKKAAGKAGIFKPRVIVCVPSGVTEVEKRAVDEAVMQAGAKSVMLIEEPMAAAIGAGMPVDKPIGNMIVDIGGGTTEVAIISLSGIVTSRTLRRAGNALDESIMSYVKKKYGLAIGDRTAEDIKFELAGTLKQNNGFYDVKGRDIVSGLPKNINIGASEILEAISADLREICMTVKSALEDTPPELASDIIENGITVCGGGAMIKNIDAFLAEELGINVHISENPLDCVALGTGMALDNKRVLERTRFYARRRK